MHDAVGAGTSICAPDRGEKRGEIDDLGFARRVLDHGFAIGRCTLLSSRFSVPVTVTLSISRRAPVGAGNAPADSVDDLDFGADRTQAGHMQVDRPGAYSAPAGNETSAC